MEKTTQFLDLGKQPLANGFLSMQDIDTEYFYNLKYQYDPETSLVSMIDKPAPELMFNDSYPYHSSGSRTMNLHFNRTANSIKSNYNPKTILEIGTNDGAFIRHFNKENSLCVEPCSNFAANTSNDGYSTYNEFWSLELAQKIREEHGFIDVIYAANTMCHMHDLDSALEGIHTLLGPKSVFIFEDPSLLSMLQRCSYDQLYDEHPYIFSVTALDKILRKHHMIITNVESLPVHGGSNRIYAQTTHSPIAIHQSMGYHNHLFMERQLGVDNFETYELFSEAVKRSKGFLLGMLVAFNGNVISYGATSKSTTIFNYCGIGPETIKYIIDTTKDKQCLLSPGAHIPILSPEEGLSNLSDFDAIFLGAWNFIKEILQKERRLKNKKWITHVPFPRFL